MADSTNLTPRQYAIGCGMWLLFFASIYALFRVAAVDAPPKTPRQRPYDAFAASQAIELIREYPAVSDADIRPDFANGRLNLALIVSESTSSAAARELGDNFVRACISLVEHGSPGQQIGPSQWDYLVGVFTPSGRQLALGAKVDAARSISW